MGFPSPGCNTSEENNNVKDSVKRFWIFANGICCDVSVKNNFEGLIVC
jgi:hypothetical protein